MPNPLPSPLDKIDTSIFFESSCQIYFKRDDLLQSKFQGNKYRKLKYNLEYALDKGFQEIVSFAGAYSNHLNALSFIPELTGQSVTVYVRGEIADGNNPTIQFAVSKGIRLVPLKREDYRKRNNLEFQSLIMENHPTGFLIPEGGTNEFALKGLIECGKEIIDQLGHEPDYCLVPVGSGGTFAGLIQAFSECCQVIGVTSFAGKNELAKIRSRIIQLVGEKQSNWEISDRFHFGGFAKMNHPLFEFISHFKEETGVLLDPIYTCKMGFALQTLLSEKYFSQESKIVMIHTGGIQGWGGFQQRFRNKFPIENLLTRITPLHQKTD